MTTNRDEELASTRESWDRATANHNSHKGDQAAHLRSGGDTLFPEELSLLGDLAGRSLLHVQCNSGQDSLCLARRGAEVTGVDFSGGAIAFARGLSEATGIAATFVEAEAITWLSAAEPRFDVAFASYGVVGWHADLDAWMRGVARALKPGGRLVYVDFHPLVWSFGEQLGLTGDDYFRHGPYISPVNDYVAESGAGLGAGASAPLANDAPAYSYQYTLAEIVDASIRAGLALEALREYPYSNGCRTNPSLVLSEGRRYVWPEGSARVPLMFGLSAVKRG